MTIPPLLLRPLIAGIVLIALSFPPFIRYMKIVLRFCLAFGFRSAHPKWNHLKMDGSTHRDAAAMGKRIAGGFTDKELDFLSRAILRILGGACLLIALATFFF